MKPKPTIYLYEVYAATERREWLAAGCQVTAALDLPRIELLLRKAVGAVRAMGWTIQPGRTIDRDRLCCCPIGALILACGDEYETDVEVTARIIDRHYDFENFIEGFDAIETDRHTGAHELGARLRREWVGPP